MHGRGVEQFWAVALQVDSGAAQFSAPAVRAIKAQAALKELARVERLLLKGGRASKKAPAAASDETDLGGDTSDEGSAPKAKAKPLSRSKEQKALDHAAAEKCRAAAKAKAS